MSVSLVDQNSDDRLVPVLVPFSQQFSLIHLRSAPGLSRARNIGLQHASGDLIAFPDDDCWYAPSLLKKIDNLFLEHNDWDGISCRASDEFLKKPSVWKWDRVAGKIDKRNVWGRAISISLFLRKHVVEQVGEFDLSLGLGSSREMNSGEETDYILRALKNGFCIQYLPDIVVFHEDKIPHYQKVERDRAYKYACGMGHVLRKHDYPFGFAGYKIVRPILSAILAMVKRNPMKAAYFWYVFRGRLHGWLQQIDGK